MTYKFLQYPERFKPGANESRRTVYHSKECPVLYRYTADFLNSKVIQFFANVIQKHGLHPNEASLKCAFVSIGVTKHLKPMIPSPLTVCGTNSSKY